MHNTSTTVLQQPTNQPPTNSMEQGPSLEAPQHGKKVPEFKEP